jgi:hypothetical protein
MSFLRRFLGGSSTRKLNLTATSFTRIRDDAKVEVVGEAHRQKQVVAARPPGPNDLPPGLPAPPPGHYKAMLIPEPSNEYDPNAIGVFLWAGGTWSMSGYLSRFDAMRYQPLFRHLAVRGTDGSTAVACDAALTSERGGVGVVLHLGTPGECAVELVTEDLPPAAHRWAGKYIAFTGQGGTTMFGVPLDREGQLMLARWAGCDVLPRLTKKTSALIVADSDQVTANLQKAQEYGIEIVKELDFIQGVGLPVDSIGRVTGRWARA